jgi:hypothetical protein
MLTIDFRVSLSVAGFLCRFRLSIFLLSVPSSARKPLHEYYGILLLLHPENSLFFYQCMSGLRKEKYVSIFPLETGQGSVSPIFYMEKLLYLSLPLPPFPPLPQPFLHARSLHPFHLRMDHFSLWTNLLQLGLQRYTVKKTMKQKIMQL